MVQPLGLWHDASPPIAGRTSPTKSRHIADRYRPDRLWYADDVFAHPSRLDARRTRRSCRSGELRLPFECISRAERIDEAVADALAELGCWRVWIGSESGSQRVLDAMQRRVTVDGCAACRALLRRRGIQVGMFIMLGYDGERDEDLRATVDHLKRTAPDIFLTTVSYPIKGTPYYDACRIEIVAAAAVGRAHRSRSVIRGRPSRRYYDFARRWMTGEVARHAALAARPIRARGARGIVRARRPCRHDA